MTEDQLDTLALYGVPGVGAHLHARLVERFGDASRVFRAGAHDLETVPGIGPVTAKAIQGFDRDRFLRDQLARMEACGAMPVTRTSPEYPARLAQFRSAPPVLFVRGDPALLALEGVAVVGTRRTTDYGVRMTRTLTTGLVRAGMSVVSGMAAGIDTIAHRSALDEGGVTIAVFGCGVDVIYPVPNRRLSEEIAASGCLVSHFPMGTPAGTGTFPARNAVVVGLSLGTLVVEAPESSGALITADLTLRAKRPLFAVPGNADAPGSAGPNALIRQGAHSVTTVNDILTVLGAPPVELREKPTSPTPAVSRPLPQGRAGTIIKALDSGPLQVDTLAERCGISARELAGELTMLELEGLVRQRPGKLFERR